MPAEESLRRDFRRYQLALRLVRHQARTRTISALTHLTRHQLATLRQRWGVPQDMRHRGPSPQSLAVFFRSPRARSEGSSLAVLCRRFNAVPERRGAGARKDFLSVDLGEQLCLVFEVYRSCFPASSVEFEQLLSLAIGLATADEVALGRCGTCGGAILIDLLSAPRRTCSHCQAIDGVREPRAPGGDSCSEPLAAEAIQSSLF